MTIRFLFWSFLFIASFHTVANAKCERFRIMWREDPSTTMVIAWDQISGENSTLFFDTKDFGKQVNGYSFSQKPDKIKEFKGMNNHFVRLVSLQPNTIYYFVIQDSDSVSEIRSFKTSPERSDQRLSIIAGGDSRNHREARQSANKMAAKLRPDAIMFGGDMTGGDSAGEWKQWMDDWQLTTSNDGRMHPIITARGNHEAQNSSIIELFDVPSEKVYYSLDLGGTLVRVITLNSLIPRGGEQKLWLQKRLQSSQHMAWKIGQYHHTIMPHTKGKTEQTEQILYWATLFHKYGVDLICESDAHVVKSTYPIRPSKTEGSEKGFIRDDISGTVYVGEGCWGAPLRQANNEKSWTRASGSFNQFKWIFVDQEKIEIRTVRTDGADNVEPLNDDNKFSTPYGLVLWSPPSGEVITIPRDRELISPPTEQADNVIFASRGLDQISQFKAVRQNRDVVIRWTTNSELPKMKFLIQRSIGKQPFTNVGEIYGKGQKINNYSYVDKNFATQYPGVYVDYRIVKVYHDGKTSIFSPTK